VTSKASPAAAARWPTDWAAIFSSTLIPLTVAAGFAWLAFEPDGLDDWARGLVALIPLEYFRALVLSILSDTYRESHTRAHAIRSFLLSLAILVAILLAISLFILKGDWWAWISKPDGLALLLRESGHGFAWLPDANADTWRSAALLYAAFYFAGKALLIAHAYTRAFAKSGERVLGGPVAQALIWEKHRDAAATQHRERDAAERRRASLSGDPDAEA
jgi:hypothetical protein